MHNVFFSSFDRDTSKMIVKSFSLFRIRHNKVSDYSLGKGELWLLAHSYQCRKMQLRSMFGLFFFSFVFLFRFYFASQQTVSLIFFSFFVHLLIHKQFRCAYPIAWVCVCVQWWEIKQQETLPMQSVLLVSWTPNGNDTFFIQTEYNKSTDTFIWWLFKGE